MAKLRAMPIFGSHIRLGDVVRFVTAREAFTGVNLYVLNQGCMKYIIRACLRTESS